MDEFGSTSVDTVLRSVLTNKTTRSVLARHSSRMKRTSFANVGLSKHKDFSLLTAEELHDLKEEDVGSFSLFQGFSATLPDVNNAVAMSGKLIKPDSVTKEKIGSTQSSKKLRHYKKEISYDLDLLAIKKGASLSEIKEIDLKIDRLFLLRKEMVDTIDEYDGEMERLEALAVDIEKRMELIGIIADESEEDKHANGKGIDDFVMVENEDEEDQEEEDDDDHGHTTFDSDNLSHLTSFKAHNEPITTLAIDKPFGTIVTASLDNTVRIWDIGGSRTLPNAKCTALLEGHLSTVRCMEFNADPDFEPLLATGSSDATIKLWDLSEPTRAIHSLESHVDEITALSFSGDELLSASQDKTIRQWDVNAGRLKQTIDILWASSMLTSASASASISASISHTQRRRFSTSTSTSFFAGSNANINGNPNLQNNNLNYLPSGLPLPFITCLCTLPPALASGSSDGLIRLWDLRSGELIRQLMGHTGAILDVKFNSAGRVVSSDSDGMVRVWDLRLGDVENVYQWDEPVVSVEFDQSGLAGAVGKNVVVKSWGETGKLDQDGSGAGAGTDQWLTREGGSELTKMRKDGGYVVTGSVTGHVDLWWV